MESRRCRAPSNEFSHDFMTKMKRGGDCSPSPSPQPQQRLNEIMGNFLSIAEEDRQQNDVTYD